MNIEKDITPLKAQSNTQKIAAPQLPKPKQTTITIKPSIESLLKKKYKQ